MISFLWQKEPGRSLTLRATGGFDLVRFMLSYSSCRISSGEATGASLAHRLSQGIISTTEGYATLLRTLSKRASEMK